MTLEQSGSHSTPKPASDAPEPERKGFFRFKSELSDNELADLCEALGTAFGFEVPVEEARSAQERIRAYVASMDGRVGEGVDDLLLLWFARRAAIRAALKGKKSKGKPKLHSFEIGALFGGSGGTSVMAVEDLEVPHKLVIIDPLNGYYGQPVDPVTGASVDPATLTRNLARAGARPVDFEIIQGLSENRDVISRATKYKYVSGYIDGDHSLLGIHNDWFEYTPYIQIGGYCIVDNYNDPTAVEVSHFMDNVVLAELGEYWTPVLTHGQTIVLRKDGEPPAELHERLSGYISIEAVRENVRWLAERAQTSEKQADERRLQVRYRDNKIKQMDTELERLKAEIGLAAARERAAVEQELAPQVNKLEVQLAEKTSALEALNVQYSELRSALDQQSVATDAARADMRALELDAARLNEQVKAVDAAKNEVSALKAELDKARAELTAAHNAIRVQELDAIRLTEQIKAGDAARSEAASLKSQLEATREALVTAHNAAHIQELETVRAKEQLEARLRELESARQSEAEHKLAAHRALEEASTLDLRVREQDGVIRELQFKIQQAAYEAEQQIESRKSLENALEKQKQLTAEAEAEVARVSALQNTRLLQEQLEELTLELDEARADAVKHSDERRERDNQLQKLREVLNRTEGELAATKADLDTARAETARLAEARHQLGAELHHARETLKRVESDLASTTDEMTAARAQVEKLSEQGSQLDTQLAEARKTVERVESELLVARREADAAKSEMRKSVELANAAKAEAQAVRESSEVRIQQVSADLKTSRDNAKRLEIRANTAERDAGELRGHSARLEHRLGMLEAQALAPRILLLRLGKATLVRSLELGGAILPGGAGRSLRNAALRVRRLSRRQTNGQPAGSAGAITLPAIPATPETHDAGPPRHDLTFFVNYTFGGKTRYLPRTEFLRHTLRAGRALRELKGAFKGQRCFVMGNGPSLNHQNLQQLRNEFTIGANYIYMNKEKMGFSPTLISFANYLVIQQRLDEILALDDSIKVLPYYLFDDFGAPNDTLIINMQHQTPEFSLDATCYTSTQSTVTYVNLQLAYYLGFDEVCLIGCDNRYIQPDRGKEGTVLTQEEDDPNHFTPAYFKGLKWQKGDMDRMEQLYARAGQAFSDRGSKVIDCTYNGALTVFEKGDLDTVVRRKPAPPVKLVDRVKTTFRDVSRNAARFEPATVILTVSPDLADQFGHHYNMDAFLRAKAHEAGQELVSLCAAKVDQRLADHSNWLLPTFSVSSWYSQLPPDVVARKRQTFENELLKGLSVAMAAFEPGTRFILYMYTGNLHLAKSLAEVASQFDNVDAHAHHFYGAMADMEVDSIRDEATACIRDIRHLGARLYLGTPDLVDHFKEKTGYMLETLGDPSVTFSDREIEALIAAGSTPRETIEGPARVFFPPNMNLEKGYGTVLDVVNSITASDSLSKAFRPIFRFVPRENTPPVLVERAEALRGKAGVEVLEGVLSDDAFKTATLSADIIAITYSVSAFRRRMSGSLTDAIMAAKPIVATRGTYVGNHVERYGCGEVFDEGDIHSLIAALEKVRNNYGHYHRAAIAARTRHFRTCNWNNLYLQLTE